LSIPTVDPHRRMWLAAAVIAVTLAQRLPGIGVGRWLSGAAGTLLRLLWVPLVFINFLSGFANAGVAPSVFRIGRGGLGWALAVAPGAALVAAARRKEARA